MCSPGGSAVAWILVMAMLSLVTQPSYPARYNQDGYNQACEMLIAIDEPLYRSQGQDLAKIKQLAKDHVNEINKIYHKTFFKGNFGHLYFRIKEVRVLFDFCQDCNQTHEVFLQEFTRLDTSDFCLAHLFTFRDFPGGLQGLAWKGTLCREDFNTGFTTLLNHEVSSSLQQSGMTFSHEVGHNFGSDHDEDEPGCPSDYIMSSQGSKGSFVKFSHCSLKNMTMKLNNVLDDSPNTRRNCFVRKDYVPNDDNFAVCGDGIVTPGVEECDCGVDYTQCNDPCCYPAHISPWDQWINKTAVPCRRNAKIACVDPFRSIINYGLIAPWIFIGSSSIVIGVCLVIVRKRQQFAVESKGVSEKSAAKQREIRHTVFMDKKGVDAFPGYRSKQTMFSKDQVKTKPSFDNRPLPAAPPSNGAVINLASQCWPKSPSAKRPTGAPPPPPSSASFKTSLDRHLSDGNPWPVKSGQSNPNSKIDRSHIPVLEQPLVRREEPGGNRLSAEFERSPFNKPLPPLPTTGGAGSVYLADADVGGDVDMVPRRRAPPPPSGRSSWATTTTTTTDAGPSVNVSKLKGMFEK